MSYAEMMADLRAETNRNALAYIRDTVERRGFPPSRRELAAALGYASSSQGEKVIARLVAEGLLTVSVNTPRGIGITAAGMKALTEEV